MFCLGGDIPRGCQDSASFNSPLMSVSGHSTCPHFLVLLQVNHPLSSPTVPVFAAGLSPLCFLRHFPSPASQPQAPQISGLCGLAPFHTPRNRQPWPEDGLSMLWPSVAGSCHLPWVPACHWDCRAAISPPAAQQELGWLWRSFSQTAE